MAVFVKVKITQNYHNDGLKFKTHVAQKIVWNLPQLLLVKNHHHWRGPHNGPMIDIHTTLPLQIGTEGYAAAPPVTVGELFRKTRDMRSQTMCRCLGKMEMSGRTLSTTTSAFGQPSPSSRCLICVYVCMFVCLYVCCMYV